MHSTTFVLLALAASIEPGVALPVKRDPGQAASALKHPATIAGMGCVSGATWTASAGCAIAAQLHPAAAGPLTAASNGLNAVAGATALAGAAGIGMNVANPPNKPQAHVESGQPAQKPAPKKSKTLRRESVVG